MAGARAAIDYLQDEAGYSRAGHHGGGAGRWVDAPRVRRRAVPAARLPRPGPAAARPPAILNRVLCADGRVARAGLHAIHAAARRRRRDRGAGDGGAPARGRWGVRFETRPDGQGPGGRRRRPGRASTCSPRRRRAISRACAGAGRRGSRRRLRARADRRWSGPVWPSRPRWPPGGRRSHEGETRERAARPVGRRVRRRVRRGGSAASPSDVLGRGAAGRARRRVVRARRRRPRAGRRWGSTGSRGPARPDHGRLRRAARAPRRRPGAGRPLLEGLTDEARSTRRAAQPASRHERAGPTSCGCANGESVFGRPGPPGTPRAGQLPRESELRAAAVAAAPPGLYRATRPTAIVDRFAAAGRTLGRRPGRRAARGAHLRRAGRGAVRRRPAPGSRSSSARWPTPGPHTAPSRAVDRWAAGVRARSAQSPPRCSPRRASPRRRTPPLARRAAPARRPAAAAGDDEALRLRRGDLVVVDEAGMAGTDRPGRDPAALRSRPGRSCCWSATRGSWPPSAPAGRWPTSPSAGSRYELAEVRRFTDEWEGAGVAAAARRRHDRAGRVRQARPARRRRHRRAGRGRRRPGLAGRHPRRARGAADGRHQRRRRPRLRRAARRAGPPRPGRTSTASRSAATAGRASSPGSGTWSRPAATPGTSTAGPATPRPRSTAETYRVTAPAPDGGLTVAPILGRAAAADGGARSWASRCSCPPRYVADRGHPRLRATVHAARAAPSTPATASSAPAPTSPRLLRADDPRPGRQHRLCRHPPRSPTTPRPARPSTSHAADRRARCWPTSCGPPEEERTALAEPETRRRRGPLDHDPRRPADRRRRRRSPPAAPPPRSTSSPPTGRLTAARPGRAGRRRRPAVAGPAAAHRRAGRPRPRRQVLADAVTARTLRRRRVAGAGAAPPDQHGPRRPAHPARHQLRRPDPARRPRQPPARGSHDRSPRPPTTGAAELGAQLAAGPAAVGASRPSARSPTRGRPDRPARSGSSGPGGPRPGGSWSATPTTTPTRSAPRPPRGLVEKAALFRAAHEALGLLDVGAEEAGMSDGRLRARVPRLANARRPARPATSPTSWPPPARPPRGPHRRHHLGRPRRRARRRRRRTATSCAPPPARPPSKAERAGPRRSTQLEYADDARARFYLHTAVTRDNADRAGAELRARGIDLDDTSDRVTAAGMARRPPRRPGRRRRRPRDPRGRSHELRPTSTPTERRPPTTGTPTPGPAPTCSTTRATSTHRPSARERSDPAPRRRVLPVDETAAAVAEAQQVLAGITARQQADAERAARDTEEAARAEELARWAEQDPADEHTDEAVDLDDSEPAFER